MGTDLRQLWKILKRFGILVFAAILFAVFAATGFAYLRETEELGTLPSQGGALISTDDGQYYSVERGNAQATPVIFTHGTAAWSGLWLPTMEHLAQFGYRTISFDMPPFGYSQHASDNDYSRQRQAKRFLAFIKALDVKPIVVAHSFSAGMVAEAAMIDESAFGGIVFVAAAIGLNSHEKPKATPLPLRNRTIRRAATALTISNPLLTGTFLRQFIHVKEGATKPIIEVLKQPMTRAGYTDAATDWLPQLFQTPLNAQSTQEEEWRKLKVPARFLWGDKDTITPLPQAEELNALVAGSSLTVLSGIGHIPQVEAPIRFQSKLLDELDAFGFRNSQGGVQ